MPDTYTFGWGLDGALTEVCGGASPQPLAHFGRLNLASLRSLNLAPLRFWHITSSETAFFKEEVICRILILIDAGAKPRVARRAFQRRSISINTFAKIIIELSY